MVRREPRFEKNSDRTREEDTLRILLEGKDLTFRQLDKFAPVDAEILDNKTMQVVSLCEIKSYYKYLKDVVTVKTSVRKIYHCQREALYKNLPLCLAWRLRDAVAYIWMTDISQAKVKWGGMPRPRPGSIWDRELLFYVDKNELTIIKF
tara:strand:- start:1143 stop:1589 length:447 start_codon:yes stop_codon:yes gene_type:complete